MKLRYLGDARDAFKWYLLQYLATETRPPFSGLLVVPMLTSDDPESNEGKTPPERFPCRPQMLPFLSRLRAKPRCLKRIEALGALPDMNRFPVILHKDERLLGAARRRVEYFSSIPSAPWAGPVLYFLDPDIGFETKTQRGSKWVRHSEVESLLLRIPSASAVMVFQYRPRIAWGDFLGSLRKTCSGYAVGFQAIHESNLAFVALAREAGEAFERLGDALRSYREAHPGLALFP